MQETIFPAPLNRLVEHLNFTLQEFEREATPENFARIVSALGAYASFGSDLAKKGLHFIKQHPMRSAFALGLVFFAVRGILGSSSSRPDFQPQITH